MGSGSASLLNRARSSSSGVSVLSSSSCMSQQPVLLTSSIPLVEEGLAHCNEASDRFDVDKTMATANLPILDSNPAAPSPMSGSPVPSVHDSASFHSLPTVQVTEPQESPPVSRSPHVPSFSDEGSVPPAHRSIRSTPTTPLPSPRRTPISRTPVEGRSPNRISGFFSHLIHRRDHLPSSPSTSAHHERTSDTPEGSVLPSRASSLVPAPRPSTPPPPLPSPSLSELGLSLAALTDHLSPSHFNSPPTSGLDVLPLVSPPAPASYALIRRVSFKSVVVMEHRGVLVAISGRRDGVRVYALDEIKKAVEWRLDVEIRREREKQRRAAPVDIFSLEKLAVRPHMDRNRSVRRSPSASAAFFSKGSQPKKVAKTEPQPPPPPPICPPPAINYTPSGPPPSYRSPSPRPQPARQPSATSLRETGGRSTSVNDVLRGAISRRPTEIIELDSNHSADMKIDWMDDSHSDDEAINVVAAGASGSQALDERTSSMMAPEPSASNTSGLATRPADLDLSGIHADPHPSMPPSPAPTLLTLRQALAAFPASGPAPATGSMSPRLANPPIVDPDPDDDEENENDGGRSTNEPISFAELLRESRLPDLPPPGSRLPQQAILISQSHPVATGDEDPPHSPASSGTQSNRARQSSDTLGSRRPRRRWSVLDGIFSPPGGQSEPSLPTAQPRDLQEALARGRCPTLRSNSPFGSPPTTPAPPQSSESTVNPPAPPVVPQSRFFSRIINHAFSHRRSEDSVDSLQPRVDNTDGNARKHQGLTPPHAPPPKLEYAVETNKKSFLAILCGENGEKVELFAGTYRTALGLSRTFILPDSPRSLELQLQGDDLVEVFLVFSQNVFGLEPATVRVREVRLGRAERRAARRRARELQVDDTLGPEAEVPPAVEDTTSVNVSVGFSIASSVSVTTEVSTGATVTSGASPSTSQSNMTHRSASVAAPKVEDIPPIPSGPYTTFQQLSFSPNFPLASIVDEYVIPPTYPDFLQYRSVYEPEVNGNADVDLSQVQFTPPGLPVLPATPPSRWYYRDPKALTLDFISNACLVPRSLLPPDLPVRREEETEFVLLKDLRQHCVDPSQPFGPTPFANDSSTCVGKPLLHPISLLSQARLFGPPALFFSSRGGHSTAIVDGRGRSVLKDRFFWTTDDDVDGQLLHSGRLGDIKRLEAFDLQDRSVLVAMRQGGFEAVDLTDALLRPADASRDVLPHFTAPPFQMNRRKIFTWRIGSPPSSSSSTSVTVTTLPRNSSRHNVAARKPGTGKGSARQDFGSVDFEGENPRSEILFLGRQEDNVYLCERDGETFRVLQLSPHDTS
ncbi:hypothetical protein EI94DRAFT_1716940 [Lactarius quietus]|nr:hypothetical protein EI94DRAFT_1716940 [Lactarius quietus]